MRHLLRVGLLLLLALTATATAWAQPVLGISGNRFTINGTPRFLVFVSYFDALRASDATLHEDFSYFQQNGIDGVRIFPNWWYCSDNRHCGGNFGSDTLFDDMAYFRPGRLARLQQVLTLAGQYGLVVDLSFARETVQGLTSRVDEIYEAGLKDTATALQSGYPHVMFDLQNEVTFNRIVWDQNNLGQDADFVGQVKYYFPDQNRIVFVSTSEAEVDDYTYMFSGGPDTQQMDVMAPHDCRQGCSPSWEIRTSSVVATMLGYGSMYGQKPVYLQEPTAYQDYNKKPEDDNNINHFLTAVLNAKNAGAAAWTFHTRKGFLLRSQSFKSQRESGDTTFIGTFRSVIGW